MILWEEERGRVEHGDLPVETIWPARVEEDAIQFLSNNAS